MTTLIPEGATRLTLVGVPQVPQRKPEWLRQHVPLAGPGYRDIKETMRGLTLHTVCEEAACPNIHECWEAREATFLIGGDQCTRACGFCAIATGKPGMLDRHEPLRVAEAVRAMGLRFAVVTGVARDDLSDGGAWLYAETLRQIRALVPGCGVELLVPDFGGVQEHIRKITDEAPEVLAHNLETVRSRFKHIRRGFRYDRTLEVLALMRRLLPPGSAVKSNLMLGLGETEQEVLASMRDLRAAGVEILTIGQYLPPTHTHAALQRYAPPEEFDRYRQAGAEMGFAHVESGPLVRSSYRAGRQAEAAGVWGAVASGMT
ncbi:MAG TPA: lipoyl synthase [Egibacteraceae bacterium]|nr:lipoyl synthase [Egibacteraceae bacterium]